MFTASRRAFAALAATLFATSAALTVNWCRAMPAMGMSMPGGWRMSMMWMPMPGQTWPGIALAFLGMWLVMMIAMMTPVFAPVLWRYRSGSIAAGAVRGDALSVVVAAGYFFVWTLFGAAAFVCGVLIAALAMKLPMLARAVPMATGVVVLAAGVLQFSAWKARRLACCRAMGRACADARRDTTSAWRYGIRIGVHCVHCCFGLTLLLLAVGAMDLLAMAFVSAAISVERLASDGLRVARFIGTVLVVMGLCLIVRAGAAW